MFGKQIENIKRYFRVVFCRDVPTLRRFMSSPLYQSCRIISTDLVAVFLKRAKVRLDRPLANGFVILENAKEIMASLFYENLRPALFNAGYHSVDVVMSDTDSLFLTMTIMSPTEEQLATSYLEHLQHVLDTSNYAPNHPRYSNLHAQELGYVKDEMAGYEITTFVGLKAKSVFLRLIIIMRKL